jgi:hypothetical protein
LWENINGEWIFMDKEMGADEYERQSSQSVVYVAGGRGDAASGGRVSAGSIAVGVAGGVIAAKAVGRVWGWFWWMVAISIILMLIV